MDKYGPLISGKRLALARHLRKVRLKVLASKFDVQDGTIQKWQMRGIPEKSFPAVAAYFGVEEWVFYDNDLTAEAFQEIIKNPELIDKYRPANQIIQRIPSLIFTYKDAFKQSGYQTGKIFKSDPFPISGDSVLIIASFWGSTRNSYIQVSLSKIDKDSNNLSISSAMAPPPRSMYVFLREDKNAIEKTTGQNFFQNIDSGDYSLTVGSSYEFEVLVYEMNSFLGT